MVFFWGSMYISSPIFASACIAFAKTDTRILCMNIHFQQVHSIEYNLNEYQRTFYIYSWHNAFHVDFISLRYLSLTNHQVLFNFVSNWKSRSKEFIISCAIEIQRASGLSEFVARS